MGAKPIFVFTLLVFAVAAKAQQSAPVNDTTLRGSAIEIIQSYKPQIKQAPKPGWIPQLPPVDSAHPVLKYEVPQQTLYYSYSSLPLRPLALTGDSAKAPFKNYIKAGAGNFSTLFLDAGIGGISGTNYETAIHLHHISQQGDLPYQQSSLSGIEAEGMLHEKQTEWHTMIEGERNQYNYYGNEQYPFPADSIKQTFTTIRAGVDMSNKDDTNTTWDYHPAFNASLYESKFNTHETTFGINAPVTLKIDSNLFMPLAAGGVFTNYSTTGLGASDNIVALMGGIDLRQSVGVTGHALVSFDFGRGGNFYVLPDVLGSYAVPGARLGLSAGWQATLRQNTFEQLTNENPYVYPSLYAPMQTRRDEVFANVLAGVGDHLGIAGRLSWWDYNELPTFLNAGDARLFYIDYIDAKAVSLQAAIRYKVANVWSVGITGDFYNFYGNTSAKVYAWGEPDVKIKGDFLIMPLPKLTITAYLALLSGIWEQDANGSPVKLDVITDLGGNAEYQIIPRLSAFVQLDNLLNEKYQRWQGYQSYGLNIYGGIRLKF
jgi:hypothetical protein